MQINEVARQTGVTVRTLHYYDQIGLLKPDTLTSAGYRIYGDAELLRLQQILFFRELDFPLDEIRRIMEHPGYDRTEALQGQRALLMKKRERIEGLIALLDELLKPNDKEESNMDFQAFDNTEIEAAKAKYAEEVKERWGDTEAYAESERRTKGYKKEQWAKINAESEEIMQAFADCRASAPDSEAAQALVQRWQAHISANFYPCTAEILSGLGQMYSCDKRFMENIDRHGAGTAAFMTSAIAAYCKAGK